MTHKIVEGCQACGMCFETCTFGAVKELKDADGYFIDADICTDCGRCLEECPFEIIEKD